MAGHLSLMGFSVNLFNRGEERIMGIKSTGGIELKGEIEGFGKVNLCTTSMQEAIEMLIYNGGCACLCPSLDG